MKCALRPRIRFRKKVRFTERGPVVYIYIVALNYIVITMNPLPWFFGIVIKFRKQLCSYNLIVYQQRNLSNVMCVDECVL